MAGGRRKGSAHHRTKEIAQDSQEKRSAGGSEFAAVTEIDDVMCPLHHIHLPDLWHPGSLHFELMMFLFALVCMSMQYLNIYNTVFWLPDSVHMYNVYFHLMDPFVIALLVVMCSRRTLGKLFRVWPWQKRKKGLFRWSWEAAKTVFKLVLIVAALLTLVLTALEVFISFFFVHFLYLLYPLVINALFLLRWPFAKPAQPSHVDQKVMQAFGAERFSTLQHVCIAMPEVNREEVERMSRNFNTRVRDVLFLSFWVTYYSVVMPLSFAQNALHYERGWAMFYAFNVWLTFLMQYATNHFSPRVVDYMHRCALHLGAWSRLPDTPPTNPAPAPVDDAHTDLDVSQTYCLWSDRVIWPHGSLVVHAGSCFRAEGILTTAEPGNFKHDRFAFLFSNGWMMHLILISVNVALAVLQLLVLLLYGTYWNQSFSMGLTIFMSCWALFRTCRNYRVAHSIYTSEIRCYSDTLDGQQDPPR